MARAFGGRMMRAIQVASIAAAILAGGMSGVARAGGNGAGGGPASATVRLVEGTGHSARHVARRVKRALAAHGVHVRGKGDVTVEVRVTRHHHDVALSVSVVQGGHERASARLQARSTGRLDQLIERSLWPKIESGFVTPEPEPARSEEPAPAGGGRARAVDRRRARGGAAGRARGQARRGTAAREGDRSGDAGDEHEVSAGADLTLEEGTTGPGLLGGKLELSAGLRIYSRHLSYTDDVFHQLQRYDLSATPSVAAELTYYPLAGRSGVAGRLGLAAGFCLSPGLDSTTSAGGTLPSSASEWRVGGRYRARAGFLDRAGVSLLAGLDYGRQSFSIEDGETMAKPPIPSVAYSWLRPSVELARAVGPLGAELDLGYRFVMRKGQIATQAYFPHAHVAAVDGRLALRYPLPADLVRVSGLTADLALDVERYFYSLHPEPGDPWIAGGALDQYVGVSLGVSYVR